MLSVLCVICCICSTAVEMAPRPALTCSIAPFAVVTMVSALPPTCCANDVTSVALLLMFSDAVACVSTPFAMFMMEFATWFAASEL